MIQDKMFSTTVITNKKIKGIHVEADPSCELFVFFMEVPLDKGFCRLFVIKQHIYYTPYKVLMHQIKHLGELNLCQINTYA